ADTRRENRHRVRVAREAGEEALELLVQQSVRLDLRLEVRQLCSGRQLAVDEQVRRLEEAGLLRELFDRVAPVAQDACGSVDETDRRDRRGGVAVAGVEGDFPGARQQLAD